MMADVEELRPGAAPEPAATASVVATLAATPPAMTTATVVCTVSTSSALISMGWGVVVGAGVLVGENVLVGANVVGAIVVVVSGSVQFNSDPDPLGDSRPRGQGLHVVAPASSCFVLPYVCTLCMQPSSCRC